MPSFEEHCNSSELRTGKRYENLHKWMDEYQKEMGTNHRRKRHSLNDIEEVRKRWGNEGVIEFLVHVIADYKHTRIRLLKVLEKIKGEKERVTNVYRNLNNEYNELLDVAKGIKDDSWKDIPKKFKKKEMIYSF